MPSIVDAIVVLLIIRDLHMRVVLIVLRGLEVNHRKDDRQAHEKGRLVESIAGKVGDLPLFVRLHLVLVQLGQREP